MGADFAYIGTRFIATQEAHASQAYKETITQAQASDIVYTDYFTGIHGNYLQQSIIQAGLDPKNLPQRNTNPSALGSVISADTNHSKAWKDIWGAGAAVGLIDNVLPVAKVIDQLEREYLAARQRCLMNTQVNTTPRSTVCDDRHTILNH